MYFWSQPGTSLLKVPKQPAASRSPSLPLIRWAKHQSSNLDLYLISCISIKLLSTIKCHCWSYTMHNHESQLRSLLWKRASHICLAFRSARRLSRQMIYVPKSARLYIYSERWMYLVDESGKIKAKQRIFNILQFHGNENLVKAEEVRAS